MTSVSAKRSRRDRESSRWVVIAADLDVTVDSFLFGIVPLDPNLLGIVTQVLP